jgi:hypothetical protein
VRRVVLARAGYRCEQCGLRERLEFHHIGNRQDRSAFNAMVLCVRCHAKLQLRRVKLVLADSAVKLFGQPNRGIEVSMTLGARRAFVAGYRAALRRARRELDGMAQVRRETGRR